MTVTLVSSVSAGFPSPASDYMEEKIDLNEKLIRHPSATFLFRVEGESMIGAFIPDNALLVVDRSERAQNDSIVVAVVDGEFTVKRLVLEFARRYLAPENPKYKSIYITEDMQCNIWGVVTYIITDAKEV
ncbi:MAG TPA: translesion error-prone DNA polymerase V autoproteolytic subunit [Flavisolibacter sp.]|jgi:DNA polymerase V|nr:translesion error-prone DNA polymerase V autoproteolytic subunit [Flavisolibacter sp.]